jgi:hypothetical protein
MITPTMIPIVLELLRPSAIFISTAFCGQTAGHGVTTSQLRDGSMHGWGVILELDSGTGERLRLVRRGPVLAEVPRPPPEISRDGGNAASEQAKRQAAEQEEEAAERAAQEAVCEAA